MPRIYLDHNATSPLHPKVLDAMLPWLTEKWGNASSREHAYGWDAAEAVEDARENIADWIGAGPHEIFFTSGTTESIYLAIGGFLSAHDAEKRGVITSRVEHAAVKAVCAEYAQKGCPVEAMPVDSSGQIDVGILEDLIQNRMPSLVALMTANNETGVLFPIREAAQICRRLAIPLFTDAAQAVGKIPFDVDDLGIDMAAFSAHKMQGPKGIGALYLRGGREGKLGMQPMMRGGGQEKGLRGGTLNVPAIVGFAEACKLAKAQSPERVRKTMRLRDALEQGLRQCHPEIKVVGDAVHRLPNTSNLCFTGSDARTLIRDVHDIAVSTRSACSSESDLRSPVLSAMGWSDEESAACIRFSTGPENTEAEIDEAIEKFGGAYAKHRWD